MKEEAFNEKTPFCDERIRAVYLCSPTESEGEDMLTDFCFEMAVHLTKGYRLILETENCFLVLQTEGVTKRPKRGDVGTLRRANELIERIPSREAPPEGGIVLPEDYLHTLFAGERLISVEKKKSVFELDFDDFYLTLEPHGSDKSVPRKGKFFNCRIYGTERLIKRGCSCGGRALPFLDGVGDYKLKCNSCRASTDSFPDARGAIDAWNAGQISVRREEDAEREFLSFAGKELRFIALPYDAAFLDSDLADCAEILVSSDDRLFMLSGRPAVKPGCVTDTREFDFGYDIISGFNGKLYPRRIVTTESEPLRFIQKETDDGIPSLLFTLGKRPLRVTPDDMSLTVGLSAWDKDGISVELKNRTMINREE